MGINASDDLEHMLIASRVHCISKVSRRHHPPPPPAATRRTHTTSALRLQIELYFLQDPSQLRQPLNLRNEAAAVSLLLARLADSGGEGSGTRQRLLASLNEYTLRTLWPHLAAGSSSSKSTSGALPADPGVPAPPGSAAAGFEAWALEHGVQAAISIASFRGGLRGCAATRDVQPGEALLSIPKSVLIYEDSVRQTDLVRAVCGACSSNAAEPAAQSSAPFPPTNAVVALVPPQGRMLMAIPGLTIDNLLIIFTMVDRQASTDCRLLLFATLEPCCSRLS